MSNDFITEFWGSLDTRYQRQRQIEQNAVVERVERDGNKQVRKVYARVQGASNTPVVGVSPNSTSLAAGQVIAVENVGTVTAPAWMLRASGLSGAVGAPMVYEFNEDVGSYQGGDLLLGRDLYNNPNFFFDESEGELLGRFGLTETMGLLATPGALFLGNRTSKHVWIDASEIAFFNEGNLKKLSIATGAITMYGATDTPSLQIKTVGGNPQVIIGPEATEHTRFTSKGMLVESDVQPLLTAESDSGIRIFSGGVQRTWFKMDGSGWLAGPDKIWWDTAGNLSIAGNFSATSTTPLLILMGARFVSSLKQTIYGLRVAAVTGTQRVYGARVTSVPGTTDIYGQRVE